MKTPLAFKNGETIDIEKVPLFDFPQFRKELSDAVANSGRVSAFFAVPAAKANEFTLYAVIAYDEIGELFVASTIVGKSYPSLTPEIPQLHWFEREIFEKWEIRPEQHPWLKPIRFQYPYVGNDAERPAIQPGVTNFFKMQGEEAHEVAVGPVHAGIIEPGHFRFQCHGEKVYHLEISLGYQHRGVEKALWGGPNKRTIHYMETLAGDTSIAHATAYCQVVEALCGCKVSRRARQIRSIAMELERLANHTGDLGAIANDVGFLPTASYCGRLRGDFLNMTAVICGNRFGRNLVRPGGVLNDIDDAQRDTLLSRLQATLPDVKNAANLLWNTPSVMGRFEGTGVVPLITAKELGLVGPAGRACGLKRDVRVNFPFAGYKFGKFTAVSAETGDVYARTLMRWQEIEQSAKFVEEELNKLSHGELKQPLSGLLLPNQFTASLTEGWRGEVCHTAITNKQGKFLHYGVIDPSFHNWIGLALSVRNEDIYDFPLCNKSFNLSYCGHDL